MKRYTFRLETVMRLRRAEEEGAREALMLANRELRDTIVARNRAEAHYRAVAAAGVSTTVPGFVADRQAAQLAADALALADQVVARAVGKVALAQVAWNNAKRRLEIIERLDERRREEYADGVRLAEIAEIDEITTARFVPSNDLFEVAR
jgi:flagellar FliJ protein